MAPSMRDNTAGIEVRDGGRVKILLKYHVKYKVLGVTLKLKKKT